MKTHSESTATTSRQVLLRIDSSLAGKESVSSHLMDVLIEGLVQNQDMKIIKRDLATESVPHIDADWIASLKVEKAELSNEQKIKRNYADEQIEQIKEANIIVIGAPMYNFSVPSVLKAWFDHIARAGETFKYTTNGPEGLLKNRKVYLVTTRGGFHKGKSSDTLIPYINNMFAFVGLTDVEIIFSEGLDMGSDNREKGLISAKEKIASLLIA